MSCPAAEEPDHEEQKDPDYELADREIAGSTAAAEVARLAHPKVEEARAAIAEPARQRRLGGVTPLEAKAGMEYGVEVGKVTERKGVGDVEDAVAETFARMERAAMLVAAAGAVTGSILGQTRFQVPQRSPNGRVAASKGGGSTGRPSGARGGFSINYTRVMEELVGSGVGRPMSRQTTKPGVR